MLINHLSGFFSAVGRQKLVAPFKSFNGNLHMSLVHLNGTAPSPLASLRKQTGYAYVMCKKALDQNDGDLDKAKRWLEAEALRHGLQKATNIGGRVAQQGLIGLSCTPNKAIMVEVNCETDFVAKNDIFKQLVDRLTNNLFELREHPGSVIPGEGPLRKVSLDLDSLKEVHEEMIGRSVSQLGENIKIKRALLASIEPSMGHLFAYTHSIGTQLNTASMLGKSAAVVALKSADGSATSDLSEVGKKLCQQVLGLKPARLGKFDDDNPMKPLTQPPPPVQDLSSSDGPDSTAPPPPKKGGIIDIEDSDAELDEDGSELVDTDIFYDQYLLFDSSRTVRDFARENNFEIVDFMLIECGEN